MWPGPGEQGYTDPQRRSEMTGNSRCLEKREGSAAQKKYQEFPLVLVTRYRASLVQDEYVLVV